MEKIVIHKSVLLNESVNGLNIKKNGIYVDATFGRGGHTKLILSKLDKNGQLLAIDRDPESIFMAKKINDKRLSIIHGLFSDIKSYAKIKKIYGKINGIIFDLGMSSYQLDNAERGFSFMKDGPLDMRMNQKLGLSAAEWLKFAKEKDISLILKKYGEEKFANRIAHEIIKQIKKKQITRTLELANIIKKTIPIKNKIKHPATRSFQAIRIWINNELSEIESALKSSIEILAPKGRLSIISFHSLEDRIVKHFIKNQSYGLQLPFKLPISEKQLQLINCKRLKNLGRIKPSNQEIINNPRSRSSILRIAEKII